MTVAAADLVAEFEADAAAAKTKYYGKVLKVTGIVGENLTSDVAGDKYIFFGEPLEDNEFKPTVQVYLVKDEVKEADELWRGQEVTVVGKCTEGTIGPFLAESRIEEAGEPVPVIEVAAGDLIKEYAADGKAADEKYENKLLVISGVVVVAKDADEQTVDVRGSEEAGEDPWLIQINYVRTEDALVAALEKIKPGDEIKFKAECSGKAPFGVKRIKVWYARILSP